MGNLAIFDLDNTLLQGDSDVAWGDFLSERLPELTGAHYQQQSAAFYEQYEQGTLDIHEYHRFVLAPIQQLSHHELATLHADFMNTVIPPMVLPKAQARVNQHKTAGDITLIITATNSIVTQAIAPLFGVDVLMGTDPEQINGKYTGKIAGTPCFQTGKIDRLLSWIEAHHAQDASCLKHAYFYSDSRNDIPLLERVGNPVAVDPDATLRAHAESHQWPIISFR
ncbi:MAG: HAD-IB family hydrolase [Gammaproteobacteria bacterium]